MDRRRALIEFLDQTCLGFDSRTGILLPHLDSLALVTLVGFVENQLQIPLDMRTFDRDRFATVDTLLAALAAQAPLQ